MGGWGSATRQGTWGREGWIAKAGLGPARAAAANGAHAGRWTALDIALAVGAFWFSKELCVAFIALKLWHQVSGHEGSVLGFAGEKWDMLVRVARG